MDSRNIKITVSYDGSGFHGWQIQPHRATIQGAIANAIESITGEKILPQGSGRTDAGVHALTQVASFAISSSIPSDNLRKALNSKLPESIRIVTLEEAPPEFHARHCAKTKTYDYRIYLGEVCPPFLVKYVYHHPYPLDILAMAEAASATLGEHDFTSFTAVDPEKTIRSCNDASASNVRTIFESKFETRGDELVYRVRGNGFLHHMVRNIVGTLLLVGKRSLRPEDISRILQAKSRSAAGPTAPAQGLYLVLVEY